MLNPDDLNDTDEALLDLLAEGRVTPRYARLELDISREYVSQRLRRLEEHGHVEKVDRGLYGLLSDPREGDDA